MPNVPNLPGVPPLTGYIPNDVVLLTFDALEGLLGSLVPQWGIFLDGVPVLTYDNQASFSYSQDWSISTYPVEGGSFQSYDKVQHSAEIRCRFSAGASVINRQQMLASIDAVMSTTQLYDVVTPEEVYTDFNFMHRDYDRDAEKAGMVVIDVYLMEVLQTATAQFQATQSPANSGQVGLGNVSANPTASSVQSSVTTQGWN